MVVIQKMFGGADSFHLMAVPLFMYAGLIMEKGGISRRLIDLANAMVGWLPGGLAAVTVVSAMFFAGISGSAAADTAAVGALLIPAMKKSGYDSDFAGAVQAAGGTLFWMAAFSAGRPNASNPIGNMTLKPRIRIQRARASEGVMAYQ